MAAPLRLVIVEGHEKVRVALEQSLGRLCGVVLLAAVADPRHAEGLIAQFAPDAVLYEPKAARDDPLAALRRVVAAGAPVLIWTSSLLPGEADAYRRCGACAVLLKDGDLPGLLRAITQVVGTR